MFTRAELLKRVWGLGDWAHTRTLDSHIMRLRRRLNQGGAGLLTNVWGVGYRLADAESHPPQRAGAAAVA